MPMTPKKPGTPKTPSMSQVVKPKGQQHQWVAVWIDVYSDQKLSAGPFPSESQAKAWVKNVPNSFFSDQESYHIHVEENESVHFMPLTKP